MISDGAQNPNTHSTFSKTYASYEPSPRIDPFEQPPCLGSILSEALRKKLLKSLPKDTNEEDLAKHEYHEQQDLIFRNKGFKSQETPKESFRKQEHSDHVSEKDSYELDHEFEMAREGFEILRFMIGLDSITHDKHIVYTPPMTYSEEVKETIGVPMEVEPLDQPHLEDLGLNTYNHDLSLSFREIPRVYESEPQPLPSFPSLDINLGGKLLRFSLGRSLDADLASLSRFFSDIEQTGEY
ncbi:hypothetical protein Tco_1418956 [Tanacetum coccineum]